MLKSPTRRWSCIYACTHAHVSPKCWLLMEYFTPAHRSTLPFGKRSVLHISINYYNVPALFIFRLLLAVKFFADCQSPGALVDTVVLNCHLHIQFESRHCSEQHPYKSTLKIRLCSNVSSKKSKHSSPLAVFFISAPMTSNSEIFAAQRVTNF